MMAVVVMVVQMFVVVVVVTGMIVVVVIIIVIFISKMSSWPFSSSILLGVRTRDRTKNIARLRVRVSKNSQKALVDSLRSLAKLQQCGANIQIFEYI